MATLWRDLPKQAPSRKSLTASMARALQGMLDEAAFVEKNKCRSMRADDREELARKALGEWERREARRTFKETRGAAR